MLAWFMHNLFAVIRPILSDPSLYLMIEREEAP